MARQRNTSARRRPRPLVTDAGICDRRPVLVKSAAVRLWSFVLLECLALGGAGAAVVAGARHLHASRGSGALQSTMLVPFDPARIEPVPIDVAHEATGTFLGMQDELLLDRMRTAEVAQAKLNKGGSSISFRLDFADGSRAAFKPEQINPQTVPRKEVAAYRINRWLGFNAVPPSTMRTLPSRRSRRQAAARRGVPGHAHQRRDDVRRRRVHARRGQLLDPGDPRLAPRHARQRAQLVALDDRRRGDPARAGRTSWSRCRRCCCSTC